MQTNILWTGRAYHSLENCIIRTTDTGSEITSTIIGTHDGTIYQVEYQIRTNQHWETLFFKLENRYGNRTEHLAFESDGKGNWTTRGKQAEQCRGCVDIDIPLTPFTNTLPINRLKLLPDAEQFIQVMYLDVLNQQIKPVHQKYRRLPDTRYPYENIPNDFEADITVDECGLVVDYPGLFARTAILG